MMAMSIAVQQERWEMAAFLLLTGLLKVTASLPPDAVQGLLEALEGNGDG